MIRAGLVGIGGYAGVYVKNLISLHEQGKIILQAATVRPQDDIPEVSAKLRDLGVVIYPDALEMMEKETSLDLAALPVGIGAHCPLTLAALKQGMNVLVEKPAAGSVAEIRQMMEMEKNSPGFVAVGFQHNYTESTIRLKKLLLSGRYGAVKHISVLGIAPRADKYYNRNEWVCRLKGPRGEAIYDSPINNAFAHYLNLALFFAGERVETSAHIASLNAELYRARESIETFDSCAVRFETEQKVEILTLFAHTAQENLPQRLRIECEKGVISWDVSGNWSVTDPAGDVCEEYKDSDPGRIQEHMFESVVSSAAGEERFLCRLTNALEHTFCIEALHQHFPVQVLGKEHFTIREEDGLHIVNGLAESFVECYNKKLLPSENGVSWAKRQKRIVL